MLELMEESGGLEEKRRRAAAERATIAGIAMMLTVANDAMLEGRGAEIDSDQLVNALDTLRRLAFALGNLARVGNGRNRRERRVDRRYQSASGIMAMKLARSDGLRRREPRATQENGCRSKRARSASIAGVRSIAPRPGSIIVRHGRRARDPADTNAGASTGRGFAQLNSQATRPVSASTGSRGRICARTRRTAQRPL